MATPRTLIVLVACLTILHTALSQQGEDNNRGNTGGGTHGQLNGQDDVPNSEIRRFLPADFKHVIPDDSSDRSDPGQGRAGAPGRPGSRGTDGLGNRNADTNTGRGNNNGNGNTDGGNHGNGCNTNNNGNNNENDDCQGTRPRVQAGPVPNRIRTTSAPTTRRPRVDRAHDRGDNGPRFVQPTRRPTRKPEDSEEDEDRYNYQSLFRNSQLAQIGDYRYWLRRFLPSFRVYYQSRRRYY